AARGGPTPAWVASTERLLEQALSRAVGQGAVDDPAVTKGLVSALKAVEQILGQPTTIQASTGRAKPTQMGEPTSAQGRARRQRDGYRRQPRQYLHDRRVLRRSHGYACAVSHRVRSQGSRVSQVARQPAADPSGWAKAL